MATTQAQQKAGQTLASVRGLFNPKPHELDPFNGVGFGNKASLQLVSGPTYQEIELKSNAVSAIRKITLTINGEEIINVEPAHLIALDQLDKIYVDNDRVVIRFADFTLRTKAGVRECELVTLPTDIVFLYVEFNKQAQSITASTTTSGTAETKTTATVQTPTLKARAKLTDAQSVRYFLPRIKTETWDHPAGGQLTHAYRERSPFKFIRRMLMRGTNASDITRLEIWRDNKVEFQLDADDNAYDLARLGKEAPDGFFPVDFLQYGFGADGKFSTAANNSLDFKITKTTPGPITVLLQSIDVVAVPTN